MSNGESAVVTGEAAYSEDFNEESQAVLPGTKQAANIAAKRSQPNLPVKKLVRDEFSDSGYSSHTGATPDSSVEAKKTLHPPKAVSLEKRKSPPGEKKPLSRRLSSAKPSQQKVASKSPNPKPSPSRPCDCPTCVSNARRSAAAPQAPHHQTSNTKTQAKQSQAPSNPVRNLPIQNVPILQPGQPRPRVERPSTRPVSFHGTIPSTSYVEQPTYVHPSPSPRYSTAPAYPPASFPPPRTPYLPPTEVTSQPLEFYPSLSPYEIPQPHLPPRRWSSVQGPHSRPHSMIYPTPSPIIEYGHEPIYAAAVPTARPPSRQPSNRERRTAPAASSYNGDYERMPPPPPPKDAPSQRPFVKKSVTTSDVRPAIHNRSRTEHTIANPDSTSSDKVAPAARTHSRRPTIMHSNRASDDSVPSTHSVEGNPRRLSIESNNSKSRHRASVYGHESLADLEESVEGYIDAQGTAPRNIVPIESLVRKKQTHSSSKSSRASSRKSEKSAKSKYSTKSGSDVRSRHPSNGNKSRKDSDALAMRFNASQGVNVEFKGNSAEGRKINLRQSRDDEGDIELNISARSREASNSRSLARANSTKGFSYVDNGDAKELERVQTSASIKSSASKEHKKRSEPKYEPRTFRERITTRIRRNSKNTYQAE